MGSAWVLMLGAMVLGLIAQAHVKSAFNQMSRVPAGLTGQQAARQMLDREGLYNVGIEQIGGELSDHYDPRSKVLRLSQDVYHGNSMAAVGVACHEAGHALQDAASYAPLVIRNMAVPSANFGSGTGMVLIMAGLFLGMTGLIMFGAILFSAVVAFQVINLPVEFDASRRARQALVAQGMIAPNEEHYVAKVLNAAAMTYVAGTVQSIMTLVYYLMLARDE
ncbi:zinc metallopeptidase [Rhodopirellula sp.]|jgi:Zn-dependent membrane protease YugP|nr:zinc metallopeptidase [Rhodopirellula sp.]